MATFPNSVPFLFQNGIVHRDLKLENILLDASGNIKVRSLDLSHLPSQHFLYR